jgi:hypothetical protein
MGSGNWGLGHGPSRNPESEPRTTQTTQTAQAGIRNLQNNLTATAQGTQSKPEIQSFNADLRRFIMIYYDEMK